MHARKWSERFSNCPSYQTNLSNIIEDSGRKSIFCIEFVHMMVVCTKLIFLHLRDLI